MPPFSWTAIQEPVTFDVCVAEMFEWEHPHETHSRLGEILAPHGTRFLRGWVRWKSGYWVQLLASCGRAVPQPGRGGSNPRTLRLSELHQRSRPRNSFERGEWWEWDGGSAPCADWLFLSSVCIVCFYRLLYTSRWLVVFIVCFYCLFYTSPLLGMHECL